MGSTNQSASVQSQTATQPQDPGEMALAILQGAIGDDSAPDAAEQTEAETEGAATPETNEKPEGAAPEGADENPIAAALAKKEAPPEKALQNQHAALTRRTRALEAEKQRLEQRQAELESKQSELEKIDGIADMVEFVAKRRGIDTTKVWEDVIDQIKNGGKRSPANEAVRAINELRREVLGSKPKPQDPQEQTQTIEQAISDWKAEAVELAKSGAEKWPTMSALPQRALAAAAYEVADEYYQETGIVPTHEQVMNYLESQAKASAAPAKQGSAQSQPAPAAGNGGATAPVAPKPKVKSISNSDASAAPDTREMSQEDRDRAALRVLQHALAQGD